eukprot:Gb_35103 [translate_table: standard]
MLMKCQVSSLNVPSRFDAKICGILEFQRGTLKSAFRYLGVPIFCRNKTSEECSPSLEKNQKKLESWAFKWLSYSVRLTLSKSVPYAEIWKEF